MRLTTLILITAILQVSAASFAQKITLSEKNSSLITVFDKIRIQSGYDFIVTDAMLKNTRPVNIEVRNLELNEVLQRLFKDQPFEYTVRDKSVLLKAKEPGLLEHIIARFRDIEIKGRVVNEKGEGLPGASIRIKGGNTTTMVSTGDRGVFSIILPGNDAVLVISYLGYKTQEVSVSGADVDLVIRMEAATQKLEEVTIVSTGYQNVPKERATGSFEKIDNKLFNRNAGQNIIPRLEGMAAGVQFDKRSLSGTAPGLNELSIRGLSTLEANRAPLIVLDNFPYEGDVSNINPNDVESITILKDAAASSIWGVRAGNGVIVINTKKGAYDKPVEVSFSSNLTATAKPDLFYLPQMKSSDYIDVERYLFAQGNYDYALSDTYYHSPVSPVVDLLDQQRSGLITAATADAKIDAMAQNDVRNDFLKYIYRKSGNQQYALNLNGGTKILTYMLSGGYDKGLGNIKHEENDRITFRTSLSIRPLKNLEFNLSSINTQTSAERIGDESRYIYAPNGIPYLKLADGEGNPLVIGRDYRASFAADPGDSRLLNWQYRPLEDLNANPDKIKSGDWLLNLGASYKLSDVFTAELKYQYQKNTSEQKNLKGADTYFTRNLINLFTQAPGSAVERPVPLGDILAQANNSFTSSTVRGQLNANKNWGTQHQLSVIAGAEIRENRSIFNSFNAYGYDPVNLNFRNVDFTTNYDAYTIPFGGGRIPSALNFSGQTYRFTSLYSNAAYTYANRYTLSGSARKDASNLFGVSSNQRGVPLWSAGTAWNIASEPFYKLSFLPVLRLRATYGYNGNTSNNVSAYSVLQRSSASSPYTNLPFSSIKNPANDELRWEKVRIVNLGLDFGLKNNTLSGSVEYFRKRSTDVLYITPVPLSTGFLFTTINAVTMKGEGIDLTMHSNNLGTAKLKWNSDLLLSYNQNKVTKYTPVSEPTADAYITNSDAALYPVLGRPISSVFSYNWAGLDPENGDPRGLDENGNPSKDYQALTTVPITDLKFHGSSIPVYYGSLRNTISFQQFSLSANITWKFDYYFKRQSINYSDLFNNGRGNAAYSQRWQKPGDEHTTDVPSMVYPGDSYRDQFYAGSSVLIEKGDHIRLQDITAAFTVGKAGKIFKQLRLYASVYNLGFIWRANKLGIDPDYGSNYPAPKTIALGLNADF